MVTNSFKKYLIYCDDIAIKMPLSHWVCGSNGRGWG